MNDNLPLMDTDGQRLYLNSMLSSPELFAKVNNIVVPKYFDPDIGKGIKFIQSYFAEHRAVPSTSVFTAATKIPTDNVHLAASDVAYVSNQIAEFCKFRACIQVIQEAAGTGGLIEKGDLATMVAHLKKAVEIGLNADLGINYFENPLERMMLADTDPDVISTGWDSVDAVIGGGVGRQELIVFLAPSGGGKSVGMLNLGYNFLSRGLHGVYISLEMAGRKVATRTDQIMARMSASSVNLNRTQAAHEISQFYERSGAKFFIKRMRESTTCANDIIAYLRELETAHAFKPDFVIVDYLDIMAPNGTNFDSDSIFMKEKLITEEVRAIGFDFDCIMISAAQLEKGATDKINAGQKMTQSNLQGGSSKTNTADLMIAIARTEAMMSAGEVRFDFPKSRNSGANMTQVMMNWDSNLRISDFDTSNMSFRAKGENGASPLQRKNKTPLELANEGIGKKKATLDDIAAQFGGS